MNGLEVAGTMDLSRHNNDKSTFLLRQCQPQVMPHMCVSLNKTNRVRLIVSSSDISEEDELHLTTKVSSLILRNASSGYVCDLAFLTRPSPVR